ncbi:3755_t:CDS:2, partial [Cetraspora pellucida]
PSRNNVLGCVSAYVDTLEQNSSGSFSNLYNVPFAIIVVFIVISFVLTQTGAIQGISKIFINHDKAENGNSANNSISHNTKHPGHEILSSTSNSSSTHLAPTSNLDPFHYNPAGCPCPIHHNHNIINGAAVSNSTDKTTSQSILTITQAPSIFDLFCAAQFFMTTALVSLSNISSGYRNLASKLSWLSGLPSSLNLISSVCDKNIQIAICHMTNICKTSTGIEYVNNNICGLDMSSGFSNFGMALKVPVYNLFFIAMISFFSAQALALVMLFCGLKILNNLFKDYDAFKTPTHTFIYESLYSQYHDDPDDPDIKNSCIWFFVFKTSYNFIQAVITEVAQ